MGKELMTAKAITPELILETMAEGLIVMDTEARVCQWNAAMTELTGYTEDEMLGESVFKLRAPGCTNSENIARLMQPEPGGSGCISGCECRMLSKDGEAIPVLVNARALRNPAGNVIGILQTITDFRPVEKLRREVELLQTRVNPDESLPGIVGHSAPMRELSRLVRLAANSDANVLILGESGTGKELTAAAIHNLSLRKEQPFVRVNCGALPESLLEAELFGHVKGAFTGAIRDRVGRFEAADGGTIFLDEIGEISQAVQVKLLRVLQEGEFERVGDSRTRKVDVRVIAATNQNLASAVRHGRFREDLYYRLRVFPVTVPSLRDRTEDLPALVTHFINRFSAKTGRNIRGIQHVAMRQCLGYAWPGNVRELENSIEYAFVVCPDGELIALEHLPEEVRHSDHGGTPSVQAWGESPKSRLVDARKVLADKDQLKILLVECNWNKAEAARRLGVSRTLVWKWMKKLDIPLDGLD